MHIYALLFAYIIFCIFEKNIFENLKKELVMKRIIVITVSLIMLLSIGSKAIGETPENCSNVMPTHSETTAYNWYCKKTSDHSQPNLDNMLFIPENTNTFFVDTNHSNFNDKDKIIYLTFDAGYENGNISKILDTLKNHKVTGAFFILENLVKRNPELVKRMADEGHLICNHTASHCDMSKITEKESFFEELEKLNKICKESLDIEVSKFYRPPEGRYSELNLKHATELGYKTIFWSFAYADWDNNEQLAPEAAINKILAGTHNGEILLLHPTSSTNAAILDDLITHWKSEGFRFGSLEELCK